MEIVTLLLVLALAQFTIRGFFNTEWREKAQEKIESIKKRRRFWHLMNGFGSSVFDIEWVFTIYLDHRHMETFFMSPLSHENEDQKIKNLIKEKSMIYDLIENVSILNKAIKRSGKNSLRSCAGMNCRHIGYTV